MTIAPSFLSTLTRLVRGAGVEPPTYRISGAVFPRLVGVVYLIAFVSFWVQLRGLIGSNGILPIGPYLEAVRQQTGIERYWKVPTLCWLDSSDAFLGLLCAGGTLVAALVIAGAAQAVCLFLLWAFYLSLTTAGRDFMSFQWDNLLLEVGFLAVFAAPLGIRPRLFPAAEPRPASLWLLRWLLFRLMFGSGVVKLSSGDATWRNLTALEYHYETQPLPTWVGWYAHQLPAWFQRLSVGLMFFIELAVPFLIFMPRRLRLFAFWAIVLFQLLIALTGNYNFFNLLAIFLCVLLLDDRSWPRRWRDKAALSGGAGEKAAWRWPGWLLVPVATASLVFGGFLLVRQVHRKLDWPSILREPYGWIHPLRSLNSYGLFMVMTTSRPEIVIEGSDDGRSWKAYEFQWKPGDLATRPKFVEPHQPRLDWQMWFAALGRVQQNTWLVHFLRRLLEGSPEVLDLLEHNPYPGAPPRYIRAMLYDYHFTDFETRAKDGAWWRRELRGPYTPVLALSESEPRRLVAIPSPGR